ncbi:hypothetical protein C0V82_26050 (plasmid) [Niveispirillum cyanobacteriorum]|uniref:Uncharacterized protein n=1 Tax=Niveispirillum cyanobacteriorum TaxID=1612173 RepID=A0A2K9NLD5_9PROT|nr:hypothetical protein C0V82_26050 [Niveispirillum cyanobacteriorum]
MSRPAIFAYQRVTVHVYIAPTQSLTVEQMMKRDIVNDDHARSAHKDCQKIDVIGVVTYMI